MSPPSMALSLAVVRVYQQSFDAHPNGTLAITGGALNALGDCVAQIYGNIVDRKEHEPRSGYDFPRTLRFFCFGLGISPLIGRWNLFLERRFPLRPETSSGKVSLRALSKRVACDQIIMAPIGLVLFLGSMGIMEGRSAPQIRRKYVDLYKPALLTNWTVWPFAQLVNFRYMALPYRVPFQSSCGVFWTLYLSILNARAGTMEAKDSAMRKTIT